MRNCRDSISVITDERLAGIIELRGNLCVYTNYHQRRELSDPFRTSKLLLLYTCTLSYVLLTCQIGFPGNNDSLFVLHQTMRYFRNPAFVTLCTLY